MTVQRYEHSGIAGRVTLSSDIGASDLALDVSDGTGYPSGSTGHFFIVIDKGNSAEEKVECTSRSGNHFVVTAGGRGADGTTAAIHLAGVYVQHCVTALEHDNDSAHISDSSRDDHPQYLNTARHDITARHAFGAALGTPSAAADVGTAAAAGTSAVAARSDHVHKLGTSSVIAASIASDAVTTTKILDANVTTAKVADANITTAKLLDANVTTAKIADANITQAKLDATVAKEITQIVATVAAYVGTPSEGAKAYETTNHRDMIYGRDSGWVCVTPQAATVPTAQSTTSTTYTDLATAGPAVTVLTGTRALVTLSSFLYNSGAAADVYMSFAVSGATTLAAADTNSISQATGAGQTTSRTFMVTGLTPGNNTFTSKYRVGSGTGQYANRDITVVGLP